MKSGPPILRVDKLTVNYPGASDCALGGVDLEVGPWQRLGVVGPSGSGKSTLAMAIPGLLPKGTAVAGSIRLAGEEVIRAPDRRVRRLRREVIGLVFQDPVGALDPVRSIGSQLTEALELQGEPKGSRRARGLDLLGEVGLDESARVWDSFAHQLSGGMAQRVGIALALTGDPDLLIADEPTTALDLVTQRKILDLLSRLSESRGMALLIISHDLPVVATICDRVAVMSEGRIIERGETGEIFRRPRRPETRAMIDGVFAFQPVAGDE